MNMREIIDLIAKPAPTYLQEQASMMHIPSGWSDFDGPKMVNLKVWSNPLRAELHRAINESPAMHGDPSLRGLAHAGKVYVWEADAATHDGLLRALGLYDPATGEFNYKDPSFCFFMVWGSRWAENDVNKIVVCYNGVGDNLSVLKGTVANRWGVKFEDGGVFMTI